MFHHWIALVVFLLLSLGGVLLTFIGFAGTFLVVIGAVLYNVITWSFAIPNTIILWIVGLAVFGEILEWLITYIGAKKQGVSTYGIVGTVMGAVIGASLFSVVPVFGTIVGLIVGALVGAFLGEFYHTGQAAKAWKAAKAALTGRALVILSKFLIVTVQIFLVLRAL